MSRRWLLGLILIGAIGCGSSRREAAPPAEAPAPALIRVAAASDLQAVLPVLVERFRAARGIEAVPVFGSSGNLARQIAQGAPFDVFLSANRQFVDDLAAKGLIRADSVAPYAEGSLVLTVGRGSVEVVRGLADLARPEVKHVAIANPDFAPYGVAAREALARAGLDLDAVTPKLVRAESVRQAMQYVQSGNAEAGLVAHSVASDPEVRVIALDRELYRPIVQYLGIVAESPSPGAARQFTDYLLGEQGAQLLAASGFRPARSH